MESNFKDVKNHDNPRCIIFYQNWFAKFSQLSKDQLDAISYTWALEYLARLEMYAGCRVARYDQRNFQKLLAFVNFLKN